MSITLVDRQLCHGIGFSRADPDPVLQLRRNETWNPQPLPLGGTLGLRIRANKFCLGYVKMNADGSRNILPCPEGKALRTGKQCERCRRRDEAKFMHQYHKTGQAPAGLVKYLEQPHFLYVASFAHGVSKVGTTSTHSKWNRLVQQGVVAARYIARAKDGAAIRVLEDLVSANTPLTQQVRQKSKVKGLTSWDYTAETLDALNQQAADAARELIAGQRGLDVYGIQLCDEVWRQPDFARPVLEAWSERRLHAYTEPLADREVTVRVRGVLGQSLMIDSGEDTTLRLIDAAELTTRQVEPNRHARLEVESQSSLF